MGGYEKYLEVREEHLARRANEAFEEVEEKIRALLDKKGEQDASTG